MTRFLPMVLLVACSSHGASSPDVHDATAVSPADAHANPPIDAAPPDAPACPSTATLMPGEVTRMITVGGVMRSYIVHVPPSYDATQPLPVVLDFAPKGVTAALWKLATSWSQVADTRGFIVVWPDGDGQTWNVGRCCDPALAEVDDVAFTRAIVAELQRDACVDDKRVYATGCSNGGGMSYKLACDAADLVAAVAPVDFDCMTGPTNDPSCGDCNPSRPVTEIQFRGLLDTAAPYGGGPTTVVPGLAFPGAEANFATWGTINQCTGQPVALSTNASCMTYPACAGGAETTLCTNPVGLHCLGYGSFDIVDVAWTTLSHHQLP